MCTVEEAARLERIESGCPICHADIDMVLNSWPLTSTGDWPALIDSFPNARRHLFYGSRMSPFK